MIKTVKVTLDELLSMFEQQFGHKLSGTRYHGHPTPCAIIIWCEGVDISDGKYDARFSLRDGGLEFTNLKDSNRWSLAELYLHDHPEVEAVLSVDNPYYTDVFSVRIRMKEES